MRRPLLLALGLLLLLPAAASARAVDVPAAFGDRLERAAFPVRLPARMDLDYGGRVFADARTTARGYRLALDAARDCSANVCGLASFFGAKGRRLGARGNVRLARGITGAFRPLSCGASCTPPGIAWVQGGVRYEISGKPARSGRRAFVRLANSAIRGGDRR